VLSPIVREIVERLQHHDLELQDRVIGLAAGVALALLGLRLRHGLDVSTEILPWHDLLDRFQRIAQSADRLQPALNIEKALLPHNPPAPSAHARARSSSQIRGDLARGIFRGALYSLAVLGWTEFPDRELSRGTAEARKAIALAPDQPDGYRALGRLLLAGAEYDQAQDALKRAIEI